MRPLKSDAMRVKQYKGTVYGADLTAKERRAMQKQILMVFEEMAELQKELCKYLRNGESDEAVCRVAEEIADVGIMLDQMKLLFGTGRVQREREKKCGVSEQGLMRKREALKDAASRGKRIDHTRKDENREGLHN